MTLLQGEVRQVGIEVISNKAQTFIIDNADYMIDNLNGQIDSGGATIDGHKILTLFSATTPGSHSILFTYRIGAEIFKAKIYVEVKI